MSEAGLNQIHCSRCGELNWIVAEGGGDRIQDCTSCGRPLVSVLVLLVELQQSSATVRLCPQCRAANLFRPYCFRCGFHFEEES